MRTFLRISLIALFIVVVFFAGRRSVRWIDRFTTSHHQPYYSDNKYYKLYVPLYDVYNRQADIVMVGTSLTRYADWQELLPNETVANRGIGSDISAGVLNRLPQIIKLKPKICFVEVGINDIISGVPEAEIKQNMKSIIDALSKAGVRPVLSNVIHVSASFPNSKKVNRDITNLNSYIDGLGTDVLNLNPVLAPNGQLLSEYDLYDGVHLSPAAYKIWADSVMKLVAQH